MTAQGRPQQERPQRGPMGGGPMGGMMRGGEKPRNFKATMAKLLQYLSEYKVSIIVVLIFAVASTVFMIAGPKILGKATTKLFEGIVGSNRWNWHRHRFCLHRQHSHDHGRFVSDLGCI